MRKRLFAIVLCLLMMQTLLVSACTGFVYFGDETVYGMNFDFPDTELLFRVDEVDGVKVFSMAFDAGGEYVPTVRFNSAGLFISEQMQYPDMTKIKTLGEGQYYIGDVSPNVETYDSVERVLEFVSDKQLVQRNVTVHDLYADTQGHAVVLEAGEDQNQVTSIDGKFLVMTNFPQTDTIGKAPEDVLGAGADRYQKAYQLLAGGSDQSPPELGWSVLNDTRQSGSYSTQCSLIFLPEKNEARILLKNDSDRIWILNIETGDFEVHAVDGSIIKETFPEEGLTATQLKSFGKSTEVETISEVEAVSSEMAEEVPNVTLVENQATTAHPISTYALWAVVGLGIIILMAAFLQRRRGK